MPDKLGATVRIQWCISPIVICQNQWNSISAGIPTWQWKIHRSLLHDLLHKGDFPWVCLQEGKHFALYRGLHLTASSMITGPWSPTRQDLRPWHLHINASHPLDMFFPEPMILGRWQVYDGKNDQTNQVKKTNQNRQINRTINEEIIPNK